MTTELIAKLEAYKFECEAGALANCVDWQELKKAVESDEALIAQLIAACEAAYIKLPMAKHNEGVNEQLKEVIHAARERTP